MERIRVDFNRRGRGGMLVSSLRRSSGPLSVGDVVTVFQPGEADMDASAVVSVIDEEGRLLLSEIIDGFNFMPANSPLWRIGRSSSVTAELRPTPTVLEGVGAIA